VRVFATFTEDLERLTDWLEQSAVTTVALESTGVYWIPLFGPNFQQFMLSRASRCRNY
jgi:transposase